MNLTKYVRSVSLSWLESKGLCLEETEHLTEADKMRFISVLFCFMGTLAVNPVIKFTSWLIRGDKSCLHLKRPSILYRCVVVC